MKQCPVCHSPVSPSAPQCECGYDFESGTVYGMLPEAVVGASRPMSVTVIGWLMIIGACWSLIRLPGTMSDPIVRELLADSSIPIGLILATDVIGTILGLVCAIGILGGHDWARKLYVVQWLATFVIALLALAHPSMVIGLVEFGIVCAILYSTKANAYFTRGRFTL